LSITLNEQKINYSDIPVDKFHSSKARQTTSFFPVNKDTDDKKTDSMNNSKANFFDPFDDSNK